MRLSVVVYNAQNTDGASEVAQAKSIAEKNIFPQMAPHQKLLLVPGVYGNTPKSCERAGGSGASCSIEAQEVQVVDKLDGFFECVCSLLHARALCHALTLLPEHRWAKTDGRVAGFNPWVSAEPIQMQSSPAQLGRCKKLRCKSTVHVCVLRLKPQRSCCTAFWTSGRAERSPERHGAGSCRDARGAGQAPADWRVHCGAANWKGLKMENAVGNK